MADIKPNSSPSAVTLEIAKSIDGCSGYCPMYSDVTLGTLVKDIINLAKHTVSSPVEKKSRQLMQDLSWLKEDWYQYSKSLNADLEPMYNSQQLTYYGPDGMNDNISLW